MAKEDTEIDPSLVQNLALRIKLTDGKVLQALRPIWHNWPAILQLSRQSKLQLLRDACKLAKNECIS